MSNVSLGYGILCASPWMNEMFEKLLQFSFAACNISLKNQVPQHFGSHKSEFFRINPTTTADINYLLVLYFCNVFTISAQEI